MEWNEGDATVIKGTGKKDNRFLSSDAWRHFERGL